MIRSYRESVFTGACVTAFVVGANGIDVTVIVLCTLVDIFARIGHWIASVADKASAIDAAFPIHALRVRDATAVVFQAGIGNCGR